MFRNRARRATDYRGPIPCLFIFRHSEERLIPRSRAASERRNEALSRAVRITSFSSDSSGFSVPETRSTTEGCAC